MGEDIGMLEERAASDVMRYARIALVAVGVAVVAGAGYLVYRRLRRPSRAQQMQKTLIDLLKNLPDSVREMPHEVASRLNRPMPSVKVFLNGRDEAREPWTLESVVRKMPEVVGTASSAVLERLTRSADKESKPKNSPENN